MQEEMKIGKSSDGREMHYSVGIIIECKGKYLLLDRVNPPPGFAGPAGHIDKGEEPDKAVLRELREETGITLDRAEFICEEEIPWNYCKSATVHYWYLYRASVEKENAVIDSTEAKSMKWCTAPEIKGLKMEEVWLYWFKKLKII